MKKNEELKQYVFILFLIISLVFFLAVLEFEITEPESIISLSGEMETFSSEKEFLEYIEESYNYLGYYGGLSVGSSVVQRDLAVEVTPTAEKGLDEETNGAYEPERYSETNVQVLGIDEPDIVKTNGKEIYLSSEQTYYWRYVYDDYGFKNKLKIISAYPPEDLEVLSELDEQGNILLYEDTLIVLSQEELIGFDISSPEKPEEVWKIKLNSTFVSARLYDEEIYLVTRKNINSYNPCPVYAIEKEGVSRIIECTSIYHPGEFSPVDTTYNIFLISAEAGDILDDISFVGSTGQTQVYMSEDSIYVTYELYKNYVDYFYDFFTKEGKDLLPNYLIEKLEKLNGYEISSQAKLVEWDLVFNQYKYSLNSDDRSKLENEITNRMNSYYDEHKRELERTGISKLNLELELEANSIIPGRLLNQFSMDEYENNLRVATSVGSGSKSTNDLYVLDEKLKVIGKILAFGEEERIYSVRFLGERGYVVTFKQIDPFFVIDLSDPENPEIKGELKIPGYSSYLHPVEDDLILGIGRENSNVKISLFDVSDPEKPIQKSNYVLSEYWSEVLNNHHAFLLDRKHEVFFLPGGTGGYIFSYSSNTLSLERVISDFTALRALYIEDYLYVIGEKQIIVIDETTWKDINELEL